jgi:anti-sigma regulatory factor (Ser/Thr protein kinase)
LFADGAIPAGQKFVHSVVSTTGVVIGTLRARGCSSSFDRLTACLRAGGWVQPCSGWKRGRTQAMRSQSELRLRPESAAPGLARAAIAAAASALPPMVVADAELLTSELVSNAVRHADLDPSQEIVVRIVADGNVRVEVADPGPPFDADLREPSTDSSGWGLLLLDEIATSWGVELEGSGKRVWFEVGTRRSER